MTASGGAARISSGASVSSSAATPAARNVLMAEVYPKPREAWTGQLLRARCTVGAREQRRAVLILGQARIDEREDRGERRQHRAERGCDRALLDRLARIDTDGRLA